MEVDVELVERLPEPEEGKTYRIENVEYIETPQRKLKGWRVTLREASTGSPAATMLWRREQVSLNSKLGCFIAALGKKTEEWIGKEVRFVAWRRGERRISLFTAEASSDVEKCLEAIRERLEPGRAYAVEDARAAGVDYPDRVIEEAFGRLEGQGVAYRLPTEPPKWFLDIGGK